VVTANGKTIRAGDPLYVDLHCVAGATRTSLRRVFNDRSWYKGGRWINDIQNIPKPDRRWMTLNGHPVVVHDYSAFYPSLLYAMVGCSCYGDPYTIPGYQREISKPILNIVINTKTGTAAIRAAATALKELGDRRSQADRYSTARQIVAALKARNAPIAQFFHSDAGKYLMGQESFLLWLGPSLPK
jgi:hypothetical protein